MLICINFCQINQIDEKHLDQVLAKKKRERKQQKVLGCVLYYFLHIELHNTTKHIPTTEKYMENV